MVVKTVVFLSFLCFWVDLWAVTSGLLTLGAYIYIGLVFLVGLYA